MPKTEDLTGQKFGEWTVLGLSQNKSREGKPLWVCQCSCENKTIREFTTHKIKSGKTRSCGCKAQEFKRLSYLIHYENTYDLTQDPAIIYANNTKNAYYFDLEDYDKIKNYSWYETKRGYLATSVNRKTIMFHRIIMGLSPEDKRIVDHIFHYENGKNSFYDNTKKNLRITTQANNCRNRGKSNTLSEIPGVTYDKTCKKWRVKITYQGSVTFLGAYENIEQAIEIRRYFEKIYFKDAAYKNIKEKQYQSKTKENLNMKPNMSNENPMLYSDFYKVCHDLMLPKGITKSMSYYTPRDSRVKMWDKVVVFGIQGFIKTYLVDCFNENFFSRPCADVLKEYNRVLKATFGEGNYDDTKIRKLHELGYLPIEIYALPEGTLCPIHVPIFGITNSHPDFAWLPQALESLISAECWHPMIAATVGYTYRQIVNKYYDLTCDDKISRAKALGAFDFRGEECLQSAIKAGAGWCLSFALTATIPSIMYLEENYNCDCTKETVAFGSPSTEHSTQISNFAVDGDEETFLRRLLREIYPNSNFSAVLDSYDYWNVIDNVLPKIHDDIMAHNGCMLMRGDSGDCVEVVTKTVFKLWEQFGGTINSKGYKVLDPHVKAIYGDSITVQRCEKIYQILMENGFACSNVALGVGSFSFQCIEEDDTLKPFTRDTLGVAIKATYCEINNEPKFIFKAPKESSFKKSQKGCCVVLQKDGVIYYKDGYTFKETKRVAENLLKMVFKDGKMIKEQSLGEIRNRLHAGKF